MKLCASPDVIGPAAPMPTAEQALSVALARIRELEAENARLNMEMAAYRQGCTPKDAAAMLAVKDALEAEKEASKERRHSTDTRCPNMAHKRYAMLNCTECSP